jgi:hypothetical protein
MIGGLVLAMVMTQGPSFTEWQPTNVPEVSYRWYADDLGVRGCVVQISGAARRVEISYRSPGGILHILAAAPRDERTLTGCVRVEKVDGYNHRDRSGRPSRCQKQICPTMPKAF